MARPASATIRRAGSGDLETLRALHALTFPADPHENYSAGLWWLVLDGVDPVGFAGLRTARTDPRAAYFCRAGVLPSHRGLGIQGRLIRTRLAAAKKAGYARVITTTYENPASANNLIRAGFLTYLPKAPWGAAGTIYWLKSLT